jgi:hypothetical protein
VNAGSLSTILDFFGVRCPLSDIGIGVSGCRETSDN